jgi:uncharacterized membrane protein YkgB
MTTATLAPNQGWSGEERRAPRQFDRTGINTKRIGECVFRYGLALIFVWLGLLKFTLYEANAIQALISHSPLFTLAYERLSVQDVSNMVGVIEISIGIMLATRSFWPSLSAIGSVGAVLTFLVTLSFILTTPGIWQAGYGFPALSATPGQFLLKDVVLLGVSLWTLGEAMRAERLQ